MTIAEKLMAEGRAKGGEPKAKLHVDAAAQARLVSMPIDELDASLQRAATVASVDERLDA